MNHRHIDDAKLHPARAADIIKSLMYAGADYVAETATDHGDPNTAFKHWLDVYKDAQSWLNKYDTED